MTLTDAIERQATQSNALVDLQKSLSQQPQIDVKNKHISIIGHGSFGDLSVDLYGAVDCGELDLWDVAMAGTTVSLSSVISGYQWDDLQQYAQDAYDRERGAA